MSEVRKPDEGDEGSATADASAALLDLKAALGALLPDNETPDVVARRAHKMGLKPNSRTTMYDVYNCERLPSEGAIRAWVAATTAGDDEQIARFVEQRYNIWVQLHPGEDELPDPDGNDTKAARRHRWRRDAIVAVVAAVVTAAIAVPSTLAVTGRQTGETAPPSSAAPGPPPVVATGDDPMVCMSDATAANLDVVVPPMTVLVRFSPRCAAVWGKVIRNDAMGFENSINIVVFREEDPDGPDTQRVTEKNVGNAYSPMIVRASPAEHICVSGSVTVDGSSRTITAPPQCT